MKKRVSIYIDEDVWAVAQDAARERSVVEKRSVSASQVVENCILGMTDKAMIDPDGWKVVEGSDGEPKHDIQLCDCDVCIEKRVARKALIENNHKKFPSNPNSEDEKEPTEDELREKLEKARERVKAEQRIQTPKGDVKVNEAFTNFMGQGIKPVPKAKWRKK